VHPLARAACSPSTRASHPAPTQPGRYQFPAPSTRIPIGRPVARTWPVHTFQVRAGDSWGCTRRCLALPVRSHQERFNGTFLEFASLRLGCRILSRAFRSRCACPFSPPPFTLTAAHPSPPAPPHVCHVQPKHPCIACRTHSAQAAPLPRPEHAHTHRLPCRPHVAGPHVSGPGWRLPGCEETFFGAISTCASASSQRCHVRVRLLPCAVASCYLLSCLAVWPVRGRW